MSDKDKIGGSEDLSGSAAQTEWIVIANKLREVLLSKLDKEPSRIVDYAPSEMYDFTRAVRDCYWLEINSRTFDKNMERESVPWSQN